MKIYTIKKRIIPDYGPESMSYMKESSIITVESKELAERMLSALRERAKNHISFSWNTVFFFLEEGEVSTPTEEEVQAVLNAPLE